MKKNILFVIMSLICLSSIKSQTSIYGIGKLKLGSPTSLISELGINSEIQIVSKKTDYVLNVAMHYSGSKVYEIVCDTLKGPRIYESYYNPNVRFYYITDYEIVPGLKVQGLELRFYKNSLYSIKCNASPNLEEALTLKYGKPEKILDSKNNEFTYTYTGAKVIKTDISEVTNWKMNSDNVKCKMILMKWHNNKGVENVKYDFEFSDISHDEEISSIEAKLKLYFKDKEISKKKNSLVGF